MTDVMSGGEQHGVGSSFEEVVGQLEGVFEPARSVHFERNTWSVEDLVGETADADTTAPSDLVAGTAANEMDENDISKQPTIKLPRQQTSSHWPKPLVVREMGGGGTDAQFVPRDWRTWLNASGLLPGPTHRRIIAQPDIEDMPTRPWPAVGAENTIANIVAGAPDRNIGATKALARGWSKLITIGDVPVAADGAGLVLESTEVVASESALDAAQAVSNAEPESKVWETDHNWWEEAVAATQGTRARFFLLIRAKQPELSENKAWELATRQAYDDLRKRCPGGSVVPSDHPWDREYMHQINRVAEERQSALAELKQRHDPSDKAGYEEARAAVQQAYNGLTMFNRAVAATNDVLSVEPDTYDTIMHSFRLDGEEGIKSTIELIRQVCEADLVEDNALRTILTVSEARGIEPSDIVSSPDFKGERGSDRRELAAARLIAQGFARQVINARAAAAQQEVPVPRSTRELARTIAPTVNDRPVNSATVRMFGRAWSEIIAARNERNVVFMYYRPGSLRNPGVVPASGAVEWPTAAAAYASPAVAEPVLHTAEEDTADQAKQGTPMIAEVQAAPRPRIDIPARMQAFRERVAEVRAARQSASTQDVLSVPMQRAIAHTKVQYARDSLDIQTALIDRWVGLSVKRLALVQEASRAHESGDKAAKQTALANADRITAQLEYEGLNARGIDTQTARAAYFRASVKFPPNVLAAAGITLAAGDNS